MLEIYSSLNALTGSSLAALLAGKYPAIEETKTENITTPIER